MEGETTTSDVPPTETGKGDDVPAEGVVNKSEGKEGEENVGEMKEEEQKKGEEIKEVANEEEKKIVEEGEKKEEENKVIGGLEEVQTVQMEGEQKGEHVEEKQIERPLTEGEHTEEKHKEGEHVEGEHTEGEHTEGEHTEGEHTEGEFTEEESTEEEQTEGEHIDEEYIKEKPKEDLGEGEDLAAMLGEEEEGEATEVPEELEEEEVLEEELPPDPSAPYDFSDSKEALKAPFSLRPDQLAEVEQLWEIYQNYTPAYTDLKDFVTEVELVYLLKCLNLMTYTPEQMQELIEYCVRPVHPKGHIYLDQFVKMVTIRQRDMPIEEEIRLAVMVMDPEHTGLLEREVFRDVITNRGFKMTTKQADALVKEVDMSNDGTLGVEDVVGTMCIDLNREDIDMLLNQIYPPEEKVDNIDDLL